MTAPVTVAIADGVATITLNRPEVGNAIDVPLARALLDAAAACESNPAARCVVVTGSGKLFCAGGDLGLMSGAGKKLSAVLTELIAIHHAAILRLSRMAKPVVMLVNGPAAGAGMSLAIMGDVVLATRSAHFTPAYGAIGLTADGGLSWLLPRLVGLRKAQEIILTNRRVMAEEAETIGLVTRTVDDDALASEGAALARRLADAPVAALGAARALLAEAYETPLSQQLDRELQSMALAGAGEAQEGLAAFLAKRAPNFRGA